MTTIQTIIEAIEALPAIEIKAVTLYENRHQSEPTLDEKSAAAVQLNLFAEKTKRLIHRTRSIDPAPMPIDEFPI